MFPAAAGTWVGRTLFLTVFALVAVVWIAFYTSPRGFDLLDSGCYYLEYAFPHDSADTHTSYRFFASPIYYLLGESIIAFRWVSWIFVWGAAAVFAWGLCRHYGALRPAAVNALPFVVLLAMMLHGSSAMHTIKPAALTYNSLNLVGVLVSLGLFLSGTAHLIRTDGQVRAGLVHVAAASVVAAVDFFIKPTTAAYLLAAFFVCLLVNPAIAGRIKRNILLITAGGMLVGTILAMVLLGGPGALATRFGTLISILKNQTYMDVLLTRTVREYGELYDFLVSDLKWALPLLLITLVGAALARKNAVLQRRIFAAGAVAVTGLWVWRLFEAKLWRGSHQLYMDGVVARFYLSAMLLAAVAAVGAWLLQPGRASAEERRRRVLLLLAAALLGLAPLAGAFGSTTSVYLNGALYSCCWLAITLGALVEVAAVYQVRWHLPLVLIPTVGFSIAQLVHGQIVMPYMNPRPLWEQTERTAFGIAGSTLKVDPALHAFIEDTRVLLEEHGFKRGDDIFCFFNIPGLVYAVGGRSPVIPWYFGRIYVEDPVEEWHMRNAGEERRRNAFVITQADATRFRDHYLRGGIDFPDGYDRIGTLTNPVTQMEVGLWKPKSRP